MKNEKENRETPETLEELRSKIDVVDTTLKEAFLARMELVDRIAEVKRQSKGTVYQPGREKAMIERLTADVEPRYQESYIRFLKEILSISKDYQGKRLSGETGLGPETGSGSCGRDLNAKARPGGIPGAPRRWV